MRRAAQEAGRGSQRSPTKLRETERTKTDRELELVEQNLLDEPDARRSEARRRAVDDELLEEVDLRRLAVDRVAVGRRDESSEQAEGEEAGLRVGRERGERGDGLRAGRGAASALRQTKPRSCRGTRRTSTRSNRRSSAKGSSSSSCCSTHHHSQKSVSPSASFNSGSVRPARRMSSVATSRPSTGCSS